MYFMIRKVVKLFNCIHAKFLKRRESYLLYYININEGLFMVTVAAPQSTSKRVLAMEVGLSTHGQCETHCDVLVQIIPDGSFLIVTF